MAMTGFWAGFGQGFQAELDRGERRKLFMDEQKERRTQTLLQLAMSRGGGSGGADGESVAAINPTKVEESLLNLGVSPSSAARIMSEDPSGQAGEQLISELEKRQDPNTPFTPQLVNSIADSFVIDVQQGVAPDWQATFASFGIDDPEMAAILDSAPKPAPTVKTYPGKLVDKPLTQSEINQGIEYLNTGLLSKLYEEKAIAEQQVSANPQDNNAVIRAQQLTEAITQAENDNPTPGRALVGASLVEGLTQNDPRFSSVNLGTWETEKQKLTQPQSDPVAATVQPTQAVAPRQFGSEEDVRAAFQAGQLKIGDTVIINGEQVIIE